MAVANHHAERHLRPLAIAVGDPAGIGPAIAIDAALATVDAATPPALWLFGDAEHLQARWRRRAPSTKAARVVPIEQLVHTEWQAGEVGLVHAESWDENWVSQHAPSSLGGRAQLRILAAASQAVRSGLARALVTGPMSKAAVNASGVAFSGQTEYLAQAVGLPPEAVTMLFLGPRLRVGLVTTHLSITRAPPAITIERVQRSVRHLFAALQRLRTGKPLRIAVTGLNPHAGEGGLLGDEELRIIAPALQALQSPDWHAKEQTLQGPMSAETAFRLAQSGAVDGVVAMLHDQATIAAKLLDWGNSVNVTWGLPFVRTSVDHGVAYEAARSDTASCDGMLAAIQLADNLSRHDDES